MLTLNLPADLEGILQEIAEMTGRSKEQLIEEAIRRQIEDLEDIHVAERRLKAGEGDPGRTIPIEEIMRKYGMAD